MAIRIGDRGLWQLFLSDSFVPLKFLLHLLRENLEILYLLQTKEKE